MALRGQSVWSTLCLVCLVLFACSKVHAQVLASDDERGRTHFEAGVSYYEQERFDEAAREFREAFQLSGRPEMLINIARALEHAGQIHQAVLSLELLLERYPKTSYRAEAETELARLRPLDVQGSEAAAPPSEPAAVQPVAAPAPAEPAPAEPSLQPAADEREAPRFWPPRLPTLIVGTSALAVGIASLGVGLRAHGLYGDLEGRCDGGVCAPAQRDDRDRGQRLARTSTGLSFAALALGSATAVLWVLDVKRAKTRTQLSLSLDPRGYAAHIRWEL
jgi:tetratricopeptide (TPR) repeat protein